jgi:hypothetical protein
MEAFWPRANGPSAGGIGASVPRSSRTSVRSPRGSRIMGARLSGASIGLADWCELSGAEGGKESTGGDAGKEATEGAIGPWAGGGPGVGNEDGETKGGLGRVGDGVGGGMPPSRSPHPAQNSDPAEFVLPQWAQAEPSVVRAVPPNAGTAGSVVGRPPRLGPGESVRGFGSAGAGTWTVEDCGGEASGVPSGRWCPQLRQ